jgi:hypothetical protein
MISSSVSAPPARHESLKSSSHTAGSVSPSYLVTFVGRRNQGGILAVRIL